MQYAADSAGNLIPATKRASGVCPQCATKLIPKCGSMVVHHWAHESADCDPWWEPETMWHRTWKNYLPREQTEVTIGNHRADIRRKDGIVVELQHSPISAEEIAERETFYGRMVWLFDGLTIRDQNLILREKDTHFTFRWKHPRKTYGICQRPVYIDMREGMIFRLHKLHLGKAPYGGWGRMGYKNEFIDWLRA